MLQKYLLRRGLSLRAYAEIIGKNHAFVHKIIYGDRSPVLSDLALWTDPLALSAKEQAEFAHEALIATANPELLQLIRQLQGAQRRNRSP